MNLKYYHPGLYNGTASVVSRLQLGEYPNRDTTNAITCHPLLHMQINSIQIHSNILNNQLDFFPIWSSKWQEAKVYFEQ